MGSRPFTPPLLKEPYAETQCLRERGHTCTAGTSAPQLGGKCSLRTVAEAGGWDGPALPQKAELGVAALEDGDPPPTSAGGWRTFLTLIYSTGD